VALRGWRSVFELVAQLPSEVPRLAARRAALGSPGTPAIEALDALDRLIGLAALRHTPILHWPVQVLTLWDFHVWWGLEGWQRSHGARVRVWMQAAAEVEALASLAGLAHDHPGWCWPELAREGDAMSATAMAHPLLPPAQAVANDVTLGPPGRVLFVTGSNMSGKSTLLRAVGLNAVLAHAGGPVCAAACRLPTLSIVTSMRLADSLEDGVSYFKASLSRLALVVARAQAATASPAQPLVLYLLDELLSGTNTAEREVAVRGVVRHLVASRAIGALTSHDLSLADAPELSAHATCVHFRESLQEDEGRLSMSFDYRLRPGVATSRNALALMRVMGLGALLTGPAKAGSDGAVSPS
jgi:DNA mismatch repair ATPase MutS